MQLEDKNNSPSKRSSTPKSGKRKRRAIFPIAFDQTSPSPKPNKDKRNLDFSEKTEKEESSSQDKNVLNLPHTDFEDEEEQGADIANHVAAGHEDLPSPTPKDDQIQ